MEWVLGIGVIVSTAIAMAIVSRVQRTRLRARVRLTLTNVGNIKSRYNLRAKDLQDILQFRFLLDGDPLPSHSDSVATPAPIPSSTAAQTGGVQQKAAGAIQTSNALAGFLSMIASLLPRSVGTPLQQKVSELRRVQSKASYVQRIPAQINQVKHAASQVAPGAAAPRSTGAEHRPHVEPTGGGQVWAQTPFVQPGESLTVELVIQSKRPTSDQAHTYEVISQSADQANAPLVSAQGTTRIRGGFWARRFLPYALIGAIAVALLLLIVGLAGVGISI